MTRQAMKAQRNLILWCTIGGAALLELLLLAQLIGMWPVKLSPIVWILIHVLLSGIAASAIADGIARTCTASRRSISLLGLPICLCLPFVGIAGLSLALILGIRAANSRHREPDYWQITRNAELPFTTPIGRELSKRDRRGFAEHLLYSSDDDDLHRKVLAAGNMRAALAVTTLKTAMRHSDERIRLTAYKTLDKKVTRLNRDIQQLEKDVANSDGEDKSNIWLQIASNYWELLTLEKEEPVARKQLLAKSAEAAIQAVAVLPSNRNAHFTLGRVSLLQGDTRRAGIAFQRALELGMPAEKVTPYLAETAFDNRDYQQTAELLASIDAAFRRYPPLKHVAEYWS